MGLRSSVKQILKMCGHAMVSTVHERLDALELQALETKQLQQAQSAAGADLRTAVLEVAETQEALLKAGISTLEGLQGLGNRAVVETPDHTLNHPETGLMEFLYSYLPAPKAVDVGAHVGEVSERLLRAGYEVYAFEPNPPVYARLVERLGHCGKFHPRCCAVAREEREMPLHLAEDLSGFKKYDDPSLLTSLDPHPMFDDLRFTSTITVPVTNMAKLHRAGVVPEDVSLVKIDTEGFDLEVIRGMGEYRYPVVVAEFWDRAMPFGKASPYAMEDLVGAMRARQYPWHIVIYRVFPRDAVAWYANYNRAVESSWGNVFFFRDYDVFSQAQAWCSSALPRTYFVPPKGPA